MRVILGICEVYISLDFVVKGPVTYLLKPLLGKNFGGVAWTPFVMHWSFYSTVLPGDMQI